MDRYPLKIQPFQELKSLLVSFNHINHEFNDLTNRIIIITLSKGKWLIGKRPWWMQTCHTIQR
jgi:hypothetical protein